MFEIKKRQVFGGDVIYKSEDATCLNEALREFLKSLNGSRANLYSADLCGADLRDADLRDADLCGANLRGANLYSADLYSANLCGADLRDADLCGANLRGADLRDADLCGADLCGANLCGAKLSWSSHVVISTILKNAADKDIAKLEVAGLISIMTGWCWNEFCALDKPTEIKDWAMRTISDWAWSDDTNVPKQLVRWCVDNNIERKPWPGSVKTELEGK